jgi:hypothetical protein
MYPSQVHAWRLATFTICPKALLCIWSERLTLVGRAGSFGDETMTSVSNFSNRAELDALLLKRSPWLSGGGWWARLGSS